jgi:hypothetical protein
MGMVPVFLVGNAEGGVIKSSSGNKYESNAPSLDLIDMTVSALMGEVEKSDKVVKEFIAKYGEDALAQLAEDVISGGDGSFLRGPGDGKADDVPGLIDGSEPVMLSSGEYVVPADAVKGLGDGSESRGADRLMRMIDDIRNMKSTTGVPGQLA